MRANFTTTYPKTDHATTKELVDTLSAATQAPSFYVRFQTEEDYNKAKPVIEALSTKSGGLLVHDIFQVASSRKQDLQEFLRNVLANDDKQRRTFRMSVLLRGFNYRYYESVDHLSVTRHPDGGARIVILTHNGQGSTEPLISDLQNALPSSVHINETADSISLELPLHEAGAALSVIWKHAEGIDRATYTGGPNDHALLPNLQKREEGFAVAFQQTDTMPQEMLHELLELATGGMTMTGDVAVGDFEYAYRLTPLFPLEKNQIELVFSGDLPKHTVAQQADMLRKKFKRPTNFTIWTDNEEG